MSVAASITYFTVFVRLLAPAVLIWLAWLIYRTPYQARSNRIPATFLSVVAAGFSLEFIWEMATVRPAESTELTVYGLRSVQEFLGVLDPILLLAYAVIVAKPLGRPRQKWLWVAYGTAAVLILAWSLTFLPPRSHERESYEAFAWVQILYVNGTYLFAFVLLLHRYLTEDRRFFSRQLFFLALGVGFVALSRSLALFTGPFAPPDPASRWWTIPGRGFLMGLVILFLVLSVHRLVGRGDRRSPRRLASAMIGLLGIFFLLWSLSYYVSTRTEATRLASYVYGLRWVFFALVVAFGILRHQLFDLELRLRQTIALLAALLVAVPVGVAAGYLASAAGASIAEGRLLGLAACLGFGVAAYVGAERTARLFLPRDADPAQSQRRKLEVYEATLEYALRKPSWSPSERRFVETFRDVLGISPEDHERVLERLRTSTGTPTGPKTARRPAP